MEKWQERTCFIWKICSKIADWWEEDQKESHMPFWIVSVEALIWKEKVNMMEQYKGQAYLEYASEAAEKIREIHQLVSGRDTIPEYGSLLGDTYYLIADMMEVYLAAVGMKITDTEKFNGMISLLMFAEKNEIYGIIKKYRKWFT